MGHIRVKHGMGAALLTDPKRAEDILKTLRRNIPSSKLLSCKIRMLKSIQEVREEEI